MNAGDFAEKAMQLYKDENLRNTLGKNGKKFIENDFCWEKVSKNLVDIYNNLD
jgi:glycosyltransferase involved in cell wall biosynthesis